LILTAKTDESTVLSLFEAGADDYVTKPFSPSQIVARVKALLKRTINAQGGDEHPLESASQPLYADAYLTVLALNHQVYCDGKSMSLTALEFKLFCTLVGAPNQVFTRDTLLEILYQQDTEYRFDRIIDTHIKNIRQKIEPDCKKPTYIITVFGVGYTFYPNMLNQGVHAIED
jgi:DNA-binding response OmpR family regulator